MVTYSPDLFQIVEHCFDMAAVPLIPIVVYTVPTGQLDFPDKVVDLGLIGVDDFVQLETLKIPEAVVRVRDTEEPIDKVEDIAPGVFSDVDVVGDIAASFGRRIVPLDFPVTVHVAADKDGRRTVGYSKGVARFAVFRIPDFLNSVEDSFNQHLGAVAVGGDISDIATRSKRKNHMFLIYIVRFGRADRCPLIFYSKYTNIFHFEFPCFLFATKI